MTIQGLEFLKIASLTPPDYVFNGRREGEVNFGVLLAPFLGMIINVTPPLKLILDEFDSLGYVQCFTKSCQKLKSSDPNILFVQNTFLHP